MNLKVHSVLGRSYANGPGWRAVIWTQGCPIRCPGCFNPGTHPFYPVRGYALAVDGLVAWVKAQRTDIEGITISGGEPLIQPNAIYRLLHRIRQETDLSILLFTGFEGRIFAREPFTSILGLCDVVLAGPYDRNQRIAHGLRGSRNKEIIFVTDRYDIADFESVPTMEVVFQSDGTTVMTGMQF